MKAPVLVPVEEYLRTTYRPDCDYVDGEVLERNVGDFAVLFVLMLQQSVLGLERSGDQSRVVYLANICDELRERILAWFPAPPAGDPVPLTLP